MGKKKKVKSTVKNQWYAVKSLEGKRINFITNDWGMFDKVVNYRRSVNQTCGTLQDAESFIGFIRNGTDSQKATAYVDGSFSKKQKRFSGGAYIIHGNKLIYWGKASNGKLAELRNIAGEIEAVKMAIQYAISCGITHLDLWYDYVGIGKWADGSWGARRPETQDFIDFCNESQKKIHITFNHVKGHSGDYGNDIADRVAKLALYNCTGNREFRKINHTKGV